VRQCAGHCQLRKAPAQHSQLAQTGGNGAHIVWPKPAFSGTKSESVADAVAPSCIVRDNDDNDDDDDDDDDATCSSTAACACVLHCKRWAAQLPTSNAAPTASQHYVTPCQLEHTMSDVCLYVRKHTHQVTLA
jgi:hypothetical protein